MKLCIVGNSHVGALKKAWDLSSVSAVDVQFFAARGVGLRDLVASDKCLVPETAGLKRSFEFTSGGKGQISPAEYDAFLIYGAEARRFMLPRSQSYSDAVIAQAAWDHVENTIAFNLVCKLNEISRKPVYIGHNPLPASKKHNEHWVSEDYTNGLNVINERIYRPRKSLLVGQPPETIVDGHFTERSYAKGSTRLSVGDTHDGERHPDSDVGHMNEKFGEVWLNWFFSEYLGQ